jgi:hypothetical protein
MCCRYLLLSRLGACVISSFYQYGIPFGFVILLSCTSRHVSVSRVRLRAAGCKGSERFALRPRDGSALLICCCQEFGVHQSDMHCVDWVYVVYAAAVGRNYHDSCC